MVNNFFTICSFFYSLMLVIIYFKRKNIKSVETKLYSRIIIINILNVIVALLCAFTIINKDIIPFINDFISKSLLLLFITWELFFTTYIVAITRKGNSLIENISPSIKIILIGCYIVLSVIIYSLPLYYHNENNIVYSYGPSANLIYVLTTILILSWIIILFKNKEILKSKKSIPIILFIILTMIVVIIQKLNPGLLLITATETFITVIMYFTIENPDMKLLEEVHKSKEISDTANEEKTLFLYNMTQEIRNTTDEINDSANEILDSNSIDENKNSARNIIATTSKFTSMTNEILDVSQIDSETIKTYNSKYDIKNILKQVVNIYNEECKKKELQFRTNIDHDIPESLYGDSISLKESLNKILKNSINNTSTGYIELNVNTIIKNDICRLIITIEDSGNGIRSEELNTIKKDNKLLSEANSLIGVMNGAMMISSDYGVGTKVKVILDQKIVDSDNKEVTKYVKELDNISILACDNEAGIKIITKLLDESNTKLDTVTDGKEILNTIRNNKYDIILLDDNLIGDNNQILVSKIRSIRNFNSKIILLTRDNNYEYNNESINEGFDDYILKPLKKGILLDKINKYKDN